MRRTAATSSILVAVLCLGGTGSASEPCADHAAKLPTVRVAESQRGKSTGSLAILVDRSTDPNAARGKSLTIRLVAEHGGSPRVFKTDEADRVDIENLSAGRYTLQVVDATTDRSVAPDRVLDLGSSGGTLTIHLAGNQKFYRTGESLMPYLERQTSIALVLPAAYSERGEAAKLEKEVLSYLRDIKAPLAESHLKPYGAGNDVKSALQLVGEPIWRIELKDPYQTLQVLRTLRTIFREKRIDVSLGLPITGGGHDKVFHSMRYVVEFDEDAQLAALKGMYPNEKDVAFVRELDGKNRLWLLEIGIGATLADIEMALTCWRDRKWIKSAEPDFLFRAVAQGLPDTWPNDPVYRSFQRNRHHAWHRIREAWDLLTAIPGARKGFVASPNVVIGSLDDGVEPLHREVKCLAADNSPQLRDCYSMSSLSGCFEDTYALHPLGGGASECMRSPHGLGVFGITSACTDNGTGSGVGGGEIAAIAPGAGHVVAQKPAAFTSTSYGDALLWLGGLQPECSPTPTDGCAWRRPIVGARVINCSFELPLPTLPIYWAKTVFPRLAAEGATNKGALVVISAGNGARALSTTEAIADKNFFKVANCKKVTLGNDMREFSLGELSNYGGPIDLCAVGQNTDTLLSYSAYFCGMCACDLGVLAHSEMGGTSAAAAHVTGVAALMLTANPDLRPAQLGCLLRRTASKSGLDTRSNVPFISATGISTVDCGFSGGRSLCYGAGLLDAQAAVKAALSFTADDKCATEVQ